MYPTMSWETGGNRTMMPVQLLEDYFIDQEDGLKQLLTWFLNLVMQLEAMPSRCRTV
jgi:hypothetical protein